MEKPGSDEITEDEFDALLDAMDARKDLAADEPAVAAKVGGDAITEEEFDAVLDRLAAEKKALPGVVAGQERTTDAVVDEYLTDLCVDAPGTGVIIDLAANIGIADAAALHTQLLELAATAGDIRIEAANVESIDTAVMQLLYAFINGAVNNGRAVAWSNPSAVLVHNAEMLGLTAHLDLPVLEAAAA